MWKGDLSINRLGLDMKKWFSLFGQNRVERQVDTIIHNGALVNWASEYDALQSANVNSTFEMLTGISQASDPPGLVFVSGGYMPPWDETEEQTAVKLSAMPGYDQTKFTSETLIRRFNKSFTKAQVQIVKPGYIVGAERDGVSQSGDVLWRLVKTCIDMGSVSAWDSDLWIPVAGVDVVASLILGAASGHCLPFSGHLVKIDHGIYLRDIWKLLSDSGVTLESMSHEEWLAMVLRLMDEQGVEHPLHPVRDWVTENEGCIGDRIVSDIGSHGDLINPMGAVAQSIEYLRGKGSLIFE